MRVAGPPPRGCVGRGRWAGSGPRVSSLPSPGLPRTCVSQSRAGALRRATKAASLRGAATCWVFTRRGMGGGSRCPFPSVCGRPPPGNWGSLCRPVWRGPGAGRGPQQLEGARAGRAGAAARGSLTDYSAAERSLPNPPLCPGPQPRARSDKLLSRRLPVRAKKRRRSRADAKSPALGPGEAGAGLQAGGGGPSLCGSPRPPALWLHSE